MNLYLPRSVLLALLLVTGASALSRVADCDQDGVLNKDDKCADTPKGTAVGKNGCPKKEAARVAKVKPRCKTQIEGGATDLGNGMMALPAGCFCMGSNDGESDEKPVHRVCLSAFSMDATEVTMGDYAQATGKRPWSQCHGQYCTTPDDRLPAYYVDWNEAKSYCESQGKRLPTEAEFEYANRAGSTTTFPWGNEEGRACRYANEADATAQRKWSDWTSFSCDDGYAMLAPVGSFQANAWGLYDMAGNVWEWTADWYNGDYYGNSASRDPQGAASGTCRVFRGGCWFNLPGVLRSAFRSCGAPGDRDFILGFRCVSPK